MKFVRYLHELGTFHVRRSPARRIGAGWARRPVGQGVDGYGRKISADYEVRLDAEPRWRRVYITQISNVGSAWVIVNGEKYFFRCGDFDYPHEQQTWEVAGSVPVMT